MCKHATDRNVTKGREVTQLQNKVNYYNTKATHWTSHEVNVTIGCEVTRLQNKENYYYGELQHWTSYEVFRCYIISTAYSSKQDYNSFLNNRNSSKELMDYALNSIPHATSTANWAFSFLRHAKPHSKMLKILISALYALL